MGFNRRVRITEERDQFLLILKIGQQKLSNVNNREKKRLGRKQCLWELWDNTEGLIIHFSRVSEGEGKESRQKKIFQKIIARKLLKCGRRDKPTHSRSQQNPHQLNPKKSIPAYIIIKKKLTRKNIESNQSKMTHY